MIWSFFESSRKGCSVSHNFSLHFPIDDDHLFMCILAYIGFISFWLNIYLKLCLIKKMVSALDYKRCVCTLGIVPSSDICLNVSFQSVTCFQFLNCVFWCLTVLILMMSSLKIFVDLCFLVSCLQTLLSNPKAMNIFSYIFSQKFGSFNSYIQM